MNIWPWSRKTEDCSGGACVIAPSEEARQALEDSVLIKETAEYRWRRVDEAVDRAVAADQMVRSQRDQNHLGEIAWKALHAKFGGSPA